MAKTAAQTTAQGYADLAEYGVQGYMDLHPSTYPYATGYKWYNDPQYGIAEASQAGKEALGYQGEERPYDSIAELEAKIQDLKAMKAQFKGAEGTYIRWSLDYQIDLLEWKISRKITNRQIASQGYATALGGLETEAFQAREGARLEATGPGFVPGAEAAGTGQQRIAGAAGREFGHGGRPIMGEPPIPAWMQPYLTKKPPPAEKKSWFMRGADTEPPPRVDPLRPLGAQAELTTDQLGQMAGYLALKKGDMFDLERHWTPYTRLSESLFPKQTKLGKRWRTARQ